MPEAHYLEAELLYTLRGVLVSLFLMGIALLHNGFMFTRILFFYKRVGSKKLGTADWRQLALFFGCTLMLALVQFGAVVIWATAIYLFNLMPDWNEAFLFSGSCYTSMGIYGSSLPLGWRMISLSIAFCGLFSFGWATAATISMISDLKEFLEGKTAATNCATESKTP